MKKLSKHYGVLFNRRSGDIITTLEAGFGSSMLKLYVLQGNVKPTQDFIAFNSETGEVVYYAEGNRNGVTIHTELVGTNIENYCTGLLAELNGGV